jgi:hypothetical protein
MIQKELRALAPTWLAIAAAMVGADYTHSLLRGFGVPAYFIGAVALGAQAIGHEFSHRTLSLVLTQPVRRQRVLLVKLGVLAGMLVSLGGLAMVTLPFFRVDRLFTAAAIALPAALGFFVAPWLTMAARSPLAGTVFPVAIAGVTFAAGDWLGVRVHGYTREVDTFRVAFMSWTMGGLCATGAVMTWWTFLRLQVTDGSSADLGIRSRAVPVRSAGAAFRKRSPIWMLLIKELHLQQLALVIAGVYVAAYLLIVLAYASSSRGLGDSLGVLAVFYGGVLAILIGALASAEERQMGTHEWQQLMPMAAWQQWAIKTAAALGLTFVLGVAVPFLLMSVLPPEQTAWPRRIWPMRQPVALMLIALLTTGSLYVSSFTRSGMWALTLSVPVLLGAAIFFASVAQPIERAVSRAGLLGRLRLSLSTIGGNPVFLAVTIALLGMVLWFGLANHRSAERGVTRIAQQVLWMAASAVVGLAAVLVLGAI